MTTRADGRSHFPSSSLSYKSHYPFLIAVLGACHGHVYALVKGLLDAGAVLDGFWAEEEAEIQSFRLVFPAARLRPRQEILSDPAIGMVVNCIRPDKRAMLSVEILQHGKSVFSDKPGFLSQAEGDLIENAIRSSNCHYYIYFSEKFHAQGTILAQRFIDDGRIGKVVHYSATSPHRLNPETRPLWFFDYHLNGSILLDLGCHLAEQFLSYTHNTKAQVSYALMRNTSHPEKKRFFDFGEAILEGENGITGHLQVDWLTPDGLGSWGDCRTIITGDKGYIEIRKYIDIAREAESDHLYLVDSNQEVLIKAKDQVGFEFFSQAIEDCVLHTDTAIAPLHCLNAMRLAITIQSAALDH